MVALETIQDVLETNPSKLSLHLKAQIVRACRYSSYRTWIAVQNGEILGVCGSVQVFENDY